MRNLFQVLLIFFSVLIVSACGQATTARQSSTDSPTSVVKPTITFTQPPAPTPTATLALEPSPTKEVSQPQEPAATPEPSPTPTEVDEQPSPTPQISEPGSAAGESAEPTSTVLVDEDCTNKAAFYDDVTIPDDTVVRQSQTFTKTWRVRNEGTCAWAGYKLVYAGGEAMNANPANDLQTVEPGAIVDISVDMEAPKRGGSHTSFWQFATNSGNNFGVGAGADGLLWVRVVVDYGSESQNQAASTSSQASSSSSSSSTSASIPGCASESDPGTVNTILGLVNNARSSAGLNTLEDDSRLDAAAQQHSLDMACNDFISHTGSDGTLWYQRVADQGYANSNTARENIYVGNPAFGGDAQGAFDWWMNSQIHRDNILNSGVSQIGIAYVYNAASSYGGYYTLVVARP